MAKFVYILVLVAVTLSLAACSGSVANTAQNCADWDKNFVDSNHDGKAEGPVTCKAIEQKTNEAVDSIRAARITGVCLDIAAKATKGGKAVIVQTNAARKLWQLRWVNEFGQGYQDCASEMPWAVFEPLYAAHTVVPGK